MNVILQQRDPAGSPAALGLTRRRLASGAGHDAMAIASLCDVGMIFVRCKGGISHHPAESVAPEDVAAAIEVLEQFLLLLAKGQ